jgi:hypothetical protein
MKKKLNVDSIANELEGASLFFKKSDTPPPLPEPENAITKKTESALTDSPTLERFITPITQAEKVENQDQKRTNVPSYGRTNERTNVRTVIKPKRQKIRHAFDIYRDQLLSLQMQQLEAVQKGKRKPKLGKMVQEAIDLYLNQIKTKSNRA